MATQIGEYVKKIRTEHGMTLKELSGKTGLSVSFLSQFERGISTIAFDSLARVAEALNADIRSFMLESLATTQEKNNYVQRSYSRHISQIISAHEIQTNLSAYGRDKNMLARLCTLLPCEQSQKEASLPTSHEGEEFIYVLEGVLSLEIDSVKYLLYPEDTAHFPSSCKHMYCNETSLNVKFLIVNYPYID